MKLSLLGKGDPPNPSATAKDIQRDADIDAKLLDLPPLPPWLAHEERRRSRVDPEVRNNLNILKNK
jgi:hypothetical protein